MSILIEELLSTGIPQVLGFLSLAVPLRRGLNGSSFRRSLLTGWTLCILAFFTWAMLNQSGDPWSKPSRRLITWFILGLIAGWFPACSGFVFGKVVRRAFRIQTITWGRFVLILAVIISVLWWPGVRTAYFARVYLTGTAPALRRHTDISRLPLVLPPADARLAKIYRGLPHQMYNPGMLWHDLFLTANRDIAGYRFRTPPIEPSTDLRDALSRFFQHSGRYRPYFGAKLCGGYHPDYCFEWNSPKGSFFALLCLGCREVRLVGNGAIVHCEIDEIPSRHLEVLEQRLDGHSFPASSAN